jgi:capsular polysaccharide biosynthesis protein
MNEAESNHKQRNQTQVDTMLSAYDVRERLWTYEDFTITEEHPPFDVAGSFASLSFIGAAVRRNLRFLAILAAIGMIAGLGVFVRYPVSYQASVTVLVKNDPAEDPVSAMLTQLTLVESQSVASAAVKALGLTQSVSSFQAAYTAAVVTNQVLTITANGPTSTGAVDRANEIAAQYISFRDNMLLAQQARQVAAYAEQVPKAQQQIAALQSQLGKLQGQGAQQTRITGLQNQLKAATDMLPTLEQTVTGLTATDKSTTSSMIVGTTVLNDATLLHHSKLKDILEYVVVGLIGALAIGLGIVIVRELISDRLRRRDDIAAALGAPVRLSVGRVGKRRFWPRESEGRERDLRRIAAHLRNSTARPSRRVATLAIVAVDNAREIAPAVVILAEQCAKEGMRLLVADLVSGAPVARLLGAAGTGLQQVGNEDTPMVVVTPEDDDLIPSGPLTSAVAPGPLAAAPAKDVVSAAKRANLVLTVAELDPAVGGEYLGTWAQAAVAIFTAGRTRAARAYAVGEMLRLSGVGVISGVVVGADKTDESVGSSPRDHAVQVPTDAGAAKPAQNGNRNGNSRLSLQ